MHKLEQANEPIDNVFPYSTSLKTGNDRLRKNSRTYGCKDTLYSDNA